jgi:NitT/TauT family transport system permease protein/taurine transport system permease protein
MSTAPADLALRDPAEPLPERPGAEARRRLLRRTAMTAASLLLVLVAWEIAAYVVADEVTLPTVQQTITEFFTYMARPYPAQGDTLWQDALISSRRILIGFLLGSAAGIIIGSLMAAIRVVRELLDPIVEVIRPLPPLAFIPLFIVWFGIGETSKIVLIMVGVIPTVTIATLSALDGVPKELLQASRALGASPLYTIVHVRLRAALPGLITGLRLAMGGSWTSIVAAEMIAATSGVGYLIQQAGNYLQTTLIFGGIITISILGLVLDALLRQLLRLADPSRRQK